MYTATRGHGFVLVAIERRAPCHEHFHAKERYLDKNIIFVRRFHDQPLSVGGLCHACKNRWGLCEYVIVHTILGGSPVILWISLGCKPKWLPLKFGYHDATRTSPISLCPKSPFSLKTQIGKSPGLLLSL